MSDASDSRSYSGRARELPFSIVFNATSGSGDVAQRHQAIGDVLRAAALICDDAAGEFRRHRAQGA